MKTLPICISILFLIPFILFLIEFIKIIKPDDFNYKKQKALHIMKNKEKYTKIQIQKAQQYLDEEATASSNQS